MIPSIGRDYWYVGRRTGFNLYQEVNLLHRFRRHTYTHNKRILDDWEALFVARHYGLPVRLLDWSTNPLVALYFACQYRERPLDDGAVWALVRKPEDQSFINVFEALPEELVCTELSELPKRVLRQLPDAGKRLMRKGRVELPEPIRVKGFKVLYPFYADARMTAQGGVFTIQDDPWTPIHRYRKFPVDVNVDFTALIKFRVPRDRKADIILELESMGINDRTLFPDLAGLSSGLCQTEALRSLAPTWR